MVMQADPGGLAASPPLPADIESQDGECLGAPLEDIRAQLVAIVDSLDGALGEHAAPLLKEAKRQLNLRACRIAVIGQVKAGKSTFINALMERPGLLPTHINPWTAVVCSLHFRKSPTPPEYPAVFHLLSAGEWKQLAEGGGHLRELTEGLIPGFQPELLRAQLQVMRSRAERRLGDAFESLLGQCHRFKEMNPELIAQYVSAGDEYEPAASGERRLYSDITRAAELYFSDSPFAFPITLIDTPGTNDPFLVRDEITLRGPENPDIYVFVISALQPLSVSDIAMLRLLNGLHKDRIIVFINRADQLPNPAADALVIKATVEKRLNLEFPALRIPVIWGSARLGNLDLELRSAEPSGARESTPASPKQAMARRDDGHRADLTGIDSGMREVSAAITRMMCASGIAMLMRQIAARLAGLIKSAEVANCAEIKAIEESLVARLNDASALRTRIAEEQQSLALFEEHANALRKSFRDVGEHLDEIVSLGSSMLRTLLRDAVRDFSDEQADGLLHETPHSKTWYCDVAPLRAQLEHNYLAAVGRIAAELARVEQFLYPHLKVIVAGLLPDYERDLLETPAWPAESGPSTAALTKLLAMDFGAGWWKRWLFARRAPIDRANHVQRFIQQEFFELVEELVQGAEQHLKLRVDYTMQRVDAIGAGLRMGIDQRRANLSAELALREQCERASACVARRAVYSSALDQLENMLTRLDAIQCAA